MTNDVGELRQPNKGVDRDIEVHKRQLCTYSQYDLFVIRETLLKKRNWKQINYDTCKIISRLRLNKRGCRAGKNKSKSRPNHDNLTPVVTRRANEQKIDIANKLKLSTVNIQSIKSKDDDLLGYLLESKTDVCVVTETWLSDNNEEDGAWVSCTHLNKAPFKISISNSKNCRGGGLALIHKAVLPSNLLEEGSTRSFQFAIWSLKVPGSNVTLVALYHPPYSSKAPFTNRMIIDDITNWLPDRLIKYNNVVLIGDVNIHLNDRTSDDDAGIFSETLEAMGFIIHMASPTHCTGNTIDLIANQSGSTLDVISCKCGPYVSDHCVVNCTTLVVHEEAVRKSITYRKRGSININKFITDCDLLDITLNEVEEMVNAFNNQLKNALNDNAPEITKQVTVRKKVPWFTQEIREKKRVVRRRETIWKKYRRDDQRQALKIERSSYRRMLKMAKAESITKMVDDCNRDSKNYTILQFY